MLSLHHCCLALTLASTLAGCAPTSVPPNAAASAVIRVPQDASLAEAGQRVADGGVILISPGVYHESLQVSADDVTVRGLDRNEVVIDGELTRNHGVVATGARVAVENLTVRNFLQNGVLLTGVTDENGAGIARGPDGYVPEAAPPPVPGYLVQYVTANNNGSGFRRGEGLRRRPGDGSSAGDDACFGVEQDRAR